jgi:hypothetical protein
MVWDSDINLLQGQCYVLLLYWYDFHAIQPRLPNQESTASDLIFVLFFRCSELFLSNNDSDWHHHWCRFYNGHSATCLVRIQNYREWGPPFSSSSQRHSGACARSFCRCILSVRLPLKLCPYGYDFTPSLSQCYQCCNTPLEICFFLPTDETQVLLDLPFFLYRTTVQGHYFTDS